MKTDDQLLQMLQNRDENAIALALDLYGGAIHTICQQILSGYSSEDIEEVISDCYLALWNNISHFDESRNCSLKSYFYGIARITALNKKRQLAREVKTQSEDEVIVSLQDYSAEKQYDDVISSSIIHDLVKHMAPPDDSIFELRYYQELSVNEIALKLHITAKTVENRLLRGKKKLREQLIANGFD